MSTSKTVPTAVSRRRLLVGSVQATAGLALASLAPTATAQTVAESLAGFRTASRANRAYRLRVEAAHAQRSMPAVRHVSNGDDGRYADYAASFTKTLRHDRFGLVEGDAYRSLLKAIESGDPAAFEAIPTPGTVKLGNPQAGFAFGLEGADSAHLAAPAPPAFESAELAAEMVELYWLALTRDVPFNEYDTNPLTVNAAAELTKMKFAFPRVNGAVTTSTLFRGTAAGDLRGPFVSQFLLKNVPYPGTPIVQKIRTALPGLDYLTTFDDWLFVQNGGSIGTDQADPATRYVRNGRDLTAYIRRDFTFQLFLNAALILGGMSTPVDEANPYRRSLSQSGFATFGAPHVLDLVTRVANAALKACWYQKWSVHRRLRPEELGGRVHTTRTAQKKFPLHSDLLDSAALDSIYSRSRTYLLPQAYPEGSPTHPSYPAGHAAIAGACVTVLKAYYDEAFVIPDPVVATGDGTALTPYTGTQLTVGGELDKLASNVSLGRDTAGVHYRTDGQYGMLLGEEVAISILRDAAGCFNETFNGFSLTRFDGSRITI